jgi:hypothetical protein
LGATDPFHQEVGFIDDQQLQVRDARGAVADGGSSPLKVEAFRGQGCDAVAAQDSVCG